MRKIKGTHDRCSNFYTVEEQRSARTPGAARAVTVLWIAGRGGVRTHHAQRRRGLQPVNTSLSPGAPGATAVRLGLFWGARQMRPLPSQCHFFFYSLALWKITVLQCRLFIFFNFYFLTERRQQQRGEEESEHQRSQVRRVRKKSFKALTWPFLQRSAHMLVPSPPLISTW